MSVTISPHVVFLKDSTHKNILVILTSPRILMSGCSQDKDCFFFFSSGFMCTFHSKLKYILLHKMFLMYLLFSNMSHRCLRQSIQAY